MVPDGTRLAGHLAVLVISSASDIAHHALLARAHRPIIAEGGHGAFSVEALDLKSTKFDVKVGNEVLKDVSTFGHKSRSLLVRKDLLEILVWHFKIWEEQDKDLFGVPGYLNQVNCIFNLMKVSI